MIFALRSRLRRGASYGRALWLRVAPSLRFMKGALVDAPAFPVMTPPCGFHGSMSGSRLTSSPRASSSSRTAAKSERFMSRPAWRPLDEEDSAACCEKLAR